MFIENRVKNAIDIEINALIAAYDDENMIADHLAYYNLDWDIDSVKVGYKSMGFPHDLGDNVSCIPIGEIEICNLFKPMSKKRAEYLSRHTDYIFRTDGTIIVYMGYDCITLTK